MAPHPPHRSQLPPQQRQARSRLVQRCAEAPLLRGSLVRMARVCGKPGCRCAQGDKHVSLYLAIRVGAKRKMIYLPPEWEQRARAWVESAQEIDRLLELISQSCLEQLLREKGKARKPRSRKHAP